FWSWSADSLSWFGTLAEYRIPAENARVSQRSLMTRTHITLGLEVLLAEKIGLLRNARVGLICNPATVDHAFRHAADLFNAHQDINLTALFGPQHGIRGETQDNMIEWEGFRDTRTGVMAWSLYGQVRKPSEEMLRDVDVLVFDLQDVGTRVYTFIYTM